MINNYDLYANVDLRLEPLSGFFILVIDEVGYWTCQSDAANFLFPGMSDRHLRKRCMVSRSPNS